MAEIMLLVQFVAALVFFCRASATPLVTAIEKTTSLVARNDADLKCTSWPTAGGWQCIGGTMSGYVQDNTVTDAAACQDFCIEQGGDGCCMLGDSTEVVYGDSTLYPYIGCQWRPGGVASPVLEDSASYWFFKHFRPVTCFDEGSRWNEIPHLTDLREKHSVFATCSNDDRYSETGLSLDDCKNEAAKLGFQFIYFQSLDERPRGERCHIYRSCDTFRIAKLGGTTYMFVETCFEDNIDFRGNDINADPTDENYGRGAGKRASSNECQELCRLTEHCVFFTYKLSSSECWLKTTDSGRRSQTGAISGSKVCQQE